MGEGHSNVDVYLGGGGFHSDLKLLEKSILKYNN